MPQVPYSPTLDVAPRVGGDSYQNIQASPGAFGAGVGAATRELGQTGEFASGALAHVALSQQTMINNVGADAAFNQFQDGTQKLLYGDPDDTSKPGYYSLRGQAATDARPALLRQLDDMRTGIKGGLPNQVQQLAFDEASRRLNQYSVGGIGQHADREYNRFAIETQTAGIDIAARAVANGYNDDVFFEHNLADAGKAADAKSALSGANPDTPAGRDIFAHNRMQAEQTLYRARAVAMGNADPAAGEAYVRANVEKFDAITAHTLLNEFKTGADRAEVAAGANAVTGGVSGPVAVPPGLADAIGKQEGKGVSVQGAVEGIMPATFRQYARPGEDIANATDRAAVNQRILSDLSARFSGDPARIAVGYFSGPGNVAPAGSATPWIEDKQDANGKTTSSYVADITMRMGQAPAPASGAAPSPHQPLAYSAEQTMVENAWAEAQRRFPTRPDLQRQMVGVVYEHIQQTNVLQQKYEAEVAKQTRDSQEQAGQTVIKQLMTDPAHFDPAVIRDNPALTYTQKESLWKLAESHLAQGANNHDVNTYGAGFYAAFQKVHTAAADPDRISDPSQLWSHVGPGGDLTIAGVEKLTSEIQGARSVEGASEGQMKKSFFDAAHVQISQHGIGLGNGRDPIGEQKFAQFQIAALTAYDEGRKAGLTPQQLLTEKSPAYIGGIIPQFTRTSAEKMRDYFEANNPDLPGAKATATMAGKTSRAFSRGDLEGEMRRRGLIKTPEPAGAQVQP